MPLAVGRELFPSSSSSAPSTFKDDQLPLSTPTTTTNTTTTTTEKSSYNIIDLSRTSPSPVPSTSAFAKVAKEVEPSTSSSSKIDRNRYNARSKSKTPAEGDEDKSTKKEKEKEKESHYHRDRDRERDRDGPSSSKRSRKDSIGSNSRNGSYRRRSRSRERDHKSHRDKDLKSHRDRDRDRDRDGASSRRDKDKGRSGGKSSSSSSGRKKETEEERAVRKEKERERDRERGRDRDRESRRRSGSRDKDKDRERDNKRKISSSRDKEKVEVEEEIEEGEATPPEEGETEDSNLEINSTTINGKLATTPTPTSLVAVKAEVQSFSSSKRLDRSARRSGEGLDVTPSSVDKYGYPKKPDYPTSASSKTSDRGGNSQGHRDRDQFEESGGSRHVPPPREGAGSYDSRDRGRERSDYGYGDYSRGGGGRNAWIPSGSSPSRRDRDRDAYYPRERRDSVGEYSSSRRRSSRSPPAPIGDLNYDGYRRSPERERFSRDWKRDETPPTRGGGPVGRNDSPRRPSRSPAKVLKRKASPPKILNRKKSPPPEASEKLKSLGESTIGKEKGFSIFGSANKGNEGVGMTQVEGDKERSGSKGVGDEGEPMEIDSGGEEALNNNNDKPPPSGPAATSSSRPHVQQGNGFGSSYQGNGFNSSSSTSRSGNGFGGPPPSQPSQFSQPPPTGPSKKFGQSQFGGRGLYQPPAPVPSHSSGFQPLSHSQSQTQSQGFHPPTGPSTHQNYPPGPPPIHALAPPSAPTNFANPVPTQSTTPSIPILPPQRFLSSSIVNSEDLKPRMKPRPSDFVSSVTKRKNRPKPQPLASREFWGCSNISHYEQGKKLGQGTFGMVMKAKHRRTGIEVALKKVTIHQEKDGMPITALREVKLLKRLNHESIVPVLDMACSRRDPNTGKSGEIYMVEPYMDHDLNGMLENHNIILQTSQIKLYMKQLLEGTLYMHKVSSRNLSQSSPHLIFL